MAVGDAERGQEQHQHALTDPEPGQRDRHDLGHRDHRDERDQRGERHAGAERERQEPDGGDHRDLVHERGAEDADQVPAVVTQVDDALVHRAEEAGPVLVALEAAGGLRVTGEEEDGAERRERDARDEQRDPGRARFEQ